MPVGIIHPPQRLALQPSNRQEPPRPHRKSAPRAPNVGATSSTSVDAWFVTTVDGASAERILTSQEQKNPLSNGRVFSSYEGKLNEAARSSVRNIP